MGLKKYLQPHPLLKLEQLNDKFGKVPDYFRQMQNVYPELTFGDNNGK